MKALAITLLILSFLALGLPMIGMMVAMEPCPACVADDQAGAWGMCLAILGPLTAALARQTGQRLVGRTSLLRPLLLPRPLEKPPRFA
jgi:hypothetical protein